MNKSTSYGNKQEIYGYQTLYREIGYYITRLEQYERALKFFNEAVKKTPNDKRALFGRAWARSKAIQYEGAIEDIKTVLAFEPDSLTVLAKKALNTYLICEFEEGLVHNTRLLPLRQKPDHFAMGVMHCTEAIENCVGERTGHPLRDHFKIIRKLAWQKYFESQKPFEPKTKHKKKKKLKDPLSKLEDPQTFVKGGHKNATEPLLRTKSRISKGDFAKRRSIYQDEDEDEDELSSIKETIYSVEEDIKVIPRGPEVPFNPLQKYTTNVKNYVACKYLESVYLDKLFLEELMYQPGLRSPNKGGTAKILMAAKSGYKLVSYKQELLRTRRPFYYLKYLEATVSGALQLRQQEAVKKLKLAAKNDAENLANKLKEATENKKLKVVLETAEKLKQFCEAKPKRILPEREIYMQLVYDCVCQGHYDVMRLNEEQSYEDQCKRIYATLGVSLSREPSCDSVIENFKGVFLDWKKMIGLYEERLRNCANDNEIVWLYHELARFYAETKQCELARVYARKCINDAINLSLHKWVVNASMIITKINIIQQNRNDAQGEIKRLMMVADEIQDPNIKKYFEMCLDVVENIEFDDLHGPKILEKREKKIIDMMGTTDLKKEATHLFSLMSTMPRQRRMYIIPGVKVSGELPKEKPRERRPTIMPTMKYSVDDEQIERLEQRISKRASSQSYGGGDKGVGFIDLIKFHVD